MKQLMLKIAMTVLFMVTAQAVSADTVVVRGVNYDPIHSLEYAKGMGLDNLSDMKTAIEKDLDRLAQFRKEHSEFKDIDHLKTFYSRYDSFGKVHGKVEYNIADVVADWNAKQPPEDRVMLALGVYEFHPLKDGCGNQCVVMTQAQVKAAYESANKYGSTLIDRIIVGSEDMEIDDNIRARIANDVFTIKENLLDANIKVGTAQIGVFVLDMFNPNSSNYQK